MNIFRSLEIFQNAPIYDEYSDDCLDILELDVSMVTESDYHIHEDIQVIINEHPYPVYESYASYHSKEYMDQFIDAHDNIVDIVVQGTCE